MEGTAMTRFTEKRVLVPYDFSDASLEAVRVAHRLAGDVGHVDVVHAVLPLSAADPYSVWEPDADDTRLKKAREQMQDALADVIKDTTYLDVGIGSPSTIITDFAKDRDAGLIVIPSHGRKGVKRLLMGSVAERVVRLAECPVLVLKNCD